MGCAEFGDWIFRVTKLRGKCTRCYEKRSVTCQYVTKLRGKCTRCYEKRSVTCSETRFVTYSVPPVTKKTRYLDVGDTVFHIVVKECYYRTSMESTTPIHLWLSF